MSEQETFLHWRTYNTLSLYEVEHLAQFHTALNLSWHRDTKAGAHEVRRLAREILYAARSIYKNEALNDTAWWGFETKKYLPRTPKRIVEAWKKAQETA